MIEIIKFLAPWCGPCSLLSKTLNDLNIKYTEIDIDDFPELGIKHKIISLPTLVFIKNNLEVGRLVGNQTAASIREMLSNLEGTDD